MPKLRFIHLSDIHFGQEKNGTVFIHEDVRAELLRDCKAQREILGQASGVLITGDLAFSGLKSEYDSASNWLDVLTGIVGCSANAVQVVPGNHDIDLNAIGFLGQIVYDNIRLHDAQVDGTLEEISKEKEDLNPLLSKFKCYREFASIYGCDFISPSKPLWQKDLQLGNCTLRIRGLNSVQISDRKDSKGNLVLGSSQYIFPREEEVEYLVMIHHPVSWFIDEAKASTYLKRARVHLLGHEHKLKIEKVHDPVCGDRLEIYAGALNPPEGSSEYPYRYNWLEVSSSCDGKETNLVVKVLPRVWDYSLTAFVPDKDRLGGKEAEVFCLGSPSNTPSTPGGASVASDVDTLDSDIQGEEVANMANDDAERFARLRYFFWKYLGWKERLKVLSDLNIFPKTADQPVPQTMERLALELAKKQNLLPKLWDATMKFVPVEKREQNPFINGATDAEENI